MAFLPGLSQVVIAINVGLRRRFQGQGIRRIDLGMVVLLVDQPMEQFQDVRICAHARFQREFYGAQNGVFVVMQNQGQDIDHPPTGSAFP